MEAGIMPTTGRRNPLDSYVLSNLIQHYFFFVAFSFQYSFFLRFLSKFLMIRGSFINLYNRDGIKLIELDEAASRLGISFVL